MQGDKLRDALRNAWRVSAALVWDDVFAAGSDGREQCAATVAALEARIIAHEGGYAMAFFIEYRHWPLDDAALIYARDIHRAGLSDKVGVVREIARLMAGGDPFDSLSRKVRVAADDRWCECFRPPGSSDLALHAINALLDTCGIEGWCTDAGGRHGVSYCSTGDTYVPTIAYTSSDSTWHVAAWGDLLEDYPQA